MDMQATRLYKDVDGVWRVMSITVGKKTERFTGALSGNVRPPALDDFMKLMESEGYKPTRELPGSSTTTYDADGYLLMFRKEAAPTTTQKMATAIEDMKKAKDESGEGEQPEAPEQPTANDASREAFSRIIRGAF